MRLANLLFACTLLLPSPAFAAACAGNSMLGEVELDRPDIWNQSLADLDAIPNSTGLFWKIEKEGTAPSWLLGTIHIADPEITTFRPAIAEALAASDALALELAEIGEEGNIALANKIAPLAQLPAGESFDSAFTKEQKATLGKMTAAVGIPYFLARKMKPWFLVISLAMPPCVQAAALRGEPGVDEKLKQEAVAAGKRTVGLETIDEQLVALAALDKSIEASALVEIAKLGPETVANMFATLVETYLQERPSLDLVLTLNMPEFKESATMYRAIEGGLVRARNLRMRDRLLPVLEDGNAFVGVGALHLPGTDGLIELLRASGYTVTRVE
jgi:uncharacterized protein YbaP (TraB family)